ncbi:hypothetical protein NC652_029590 [Populus alba x Populus x berolinensis]|nr:hypothetical protein NC652_029590 [Populus alba x Populus x berolinensis]
MRKLNIMPGLSLQQFSYTGTGKARNTSRYKWELLDPDADMNYLSHQMPVDGVEIIFCLARF